MAPARSSSSLAFKERVLTNIKPLSKSPHPQIIEPTFLDLASAEYYSPSLFLYRLTDNSDSEYSRFVTRLKESLQKVLVPFYPFAGRVVNGGSSGRQISCNDSGVPFIDAFLERDLNSLVKPSAAEFQPVPELQGYDLLGMDETQRKQRSSTVEDGWVALFVQITRFKCGGVALAVTFNHVITDGQGFFNFMSAWSDIALGNGKVIKVDHDRSQADEPLYKRPLPPFETSDGHGLGVKEVEWAMKAFEVSGEAIKGLKEEVKENTQGRGYVTTGDCIAAQIWKGVSKLPPSLLGQKIPLVSVTVEGRSRFYDPPIPHLCGNSVTMILSPKLTVEEVKGVSLGSMASRLRGVLNSTKREEWLSVEALKKVEAFLASHSGELMMITNWSRFPLYDMDFGFGTPYFAMGVNGYYSTLGALGRVYIGPTSPENTSSVARVHVVSTKEVLEALQKDPEFYSIFVKH